MEYERIIYKPGRVTQIIINRPRYRNGISHPMYCELEDARFVFPFGQYDTTVWGFGPRKTKEILFEHRAVPAREAYEFGFVTRIYPNPEILEKETLAYANRIAENEQLTQVHLAKNSINRTMDIQGFTDLVNMANTACQLVNASFTGAEREDMRKSRGIARIPAGSSQPGSKTNGRKGGCISD